jgi:hypothetical protein
VTIAGDIRCRSTDKDYRLDTPHSLTFIYQFMPWPLSTRHIAAEARGSKTSE